LSAGSSIMESRSCAPSPPGRRMRGGAVGLRAAEGLHYNSAAGIGELRIASDFGGRAGRRHHRASGADRDVIVSAQGEVDRLGVFAASAASTESVILILAAPTGANSLNGIVGVVPICGSGPSRIGRGEDRLAHQTVSSTRTT